MLKKELKIFLTALMFYTRIPCPDWVDHSPEYLNKATRYFPLIGWITGGFCFTVFWLCHFIFPLPVTLILSMTAGVFITGAFHEDGFADVCDGFGGGWTREKILEIMKDSRVGAYGVIGLILLFLLKFFLLYYIIASTPVLSSLYLLLIFITAHSLSRLSAISIIFTHSYVREGETKSRPVAEKNTGKEIFLSAVFGLLPLAILCLKNPFSLLLLIPVFLLRAYMARYFKKWIGGYTGDCLGATQQVCEVIVYLSLLALWKYT